MIDGEKWPFTNFTFQANGENWNNIHAQFISIYSVFGMSLFKNVKIRPGFDDVHNFQTFGKTFSLLFQVLIQIISFIN